MTSQRQSRVSIRAVSGVRPLTNRRQLFFSMALILTAYWAARHMLHGSFGFYEDDYTLVVPAMTAEWPEARDFIIEQITRFGGQGRPLQPSMLFLLSFATGRLGGLTPAYWLAYSIVGLNSVLFYVLLRRLHDQNLALMAGLAYALFSADTTQAFLYHSFGLQQSLLYFLLASIAYLSGRRGLSHVLALGSLLSYETVYLVFLAIPLLEEIWDRNWLRRFITHVCLMAVLLGAVAGARWILGEGRLAGLTLSELLIVPLTHTLVGPFVAVGSYFLRPIQAIQSVDPFMAGVMLVAFGAIYWGLTRVEFAGAELSLVRILRLSLAALAMLALAYPLTFTVRPYAISGRDTRVHLAAVVGAALLWTALWYLAMTVTKSAKKRRLLLMTFSGILALQIGFGLGVQRDYAHAWELQQRLWESIVDRVPDLDEGTIVFLDPSGLVDTRYVDANTWSLPLVMQYVYDFPKDWSQTPRVHRLLPDWRERSLTNPYEVKAVDFRWEYVVVPWSNSVILETQAGQAVSRLEELELGGGLHQLKPTEPVGRERFPRGFLYRELIAPNGE